MIPRQMRHKAIDTGARVGAILGPTNTGKTHYAIERMLAHRSGMIGLPLRLLAREVYDRIVRIKGAPVCALVTGEEKIVPPDARYFRCHPGCNPRGSVREVSTASTPADARYGLKISFSSAARRKPAF